MRSEKNGWTMVKVNHGVLVLNVGVDGVVNFHLSCLVLNLPFFFGG